MVVLVNYFIGHSTLTNNFNQCNRANEQPLFSHKAHSLTKCKKIYSNYVFHLKVMNECDLRRPIVTENKLQNHWSGLHTEKSNNCKCRFGLLLHM